MKFETMLVKDVLKKKTKYTDHVGIEIETEGDSLPCIESDTWKSEADGSLRGESFEYVLRQPVLFTEVKSALDEMQQEWQNAGSTIKNSPNAGVHVHINVSDLTITQLYNFISLYMVVENILIDTCGEHRIGNLFCLRASDAEYLVEALMESCQKADISMFHTDELRYASINLKALGDYGSVEFRAWRSDGDLEKIYWWTSLLMHLKTLARRIENPVEIVGNVSVLGARGFYDSILGDFTKDIPYKPEYDWIVWDSVRRVQCFAFLGDW